MASPSSRPLREFLTSAITTAILCPAVIKAARHIGAIDVPNERSSHTGEIPRAGGIACAAGIAVASLAFHRPDRATTAAVATMTATGLADDIKGIKANTRLWIQLATGIAYGYSRAGGKGAAAGALVFPAVVNATNFMDGINGITGGTVLAWSGTRYFNNSGHSDPMGLIPLPAIAGSAAGFLPYNVPNATLFLGDSGSYLYGALFASWITADIATASGENRFTRLNLHSAIALYAFDTSTTLIRRIARGHRIGEAHKEHLYQRLNTENGWSHSAAALTYSLTSAALGDCLPRIFRIY